MPNILPGENMQEKRYCLNCSAIGPMTKHGRCSTCDSEAVVLAESHGIFERVKNQEVLQLEQMYQRK